jgi:hypothetical protein
MEADFKGENQKYNLQELSRVGQNRKIIQANAHLLMNGQRRYFYAKKPEDMLKSRF